jgi:hypothetical protein
VPANGRPFLYWDGHNPIRVYPAPGRRRPGQTYLCDLGPLFGYIVGAGDEGAVDCVRQGDPEFTIYSIVPEEPEEIMTVGQRRLVLQHAFYARPEITDTAEPEEDEDAD